MVLRKVGQITFSCTFNLEKFPFDEQSCGPIYSNTVSNKFRYTLLNQAGADSPGVYIAQSFSSNQWKVQGIAAERGFFSMNGSPLPSVQWTIHIKRFSTFYTYTAVIPAIVITSIVIIGLLNPDLNSRVSLAVTGLLTIVALQFSINSGLPITSDVSWLLSFTVCSTYFIAGVILQSALVIGIRYNPNRDIPEFLEWVLHFEEYLHYTLALSHCKSKAITESNKVSNEDHEPIASTEVDKEEGGAFDARSPAPVELSHDEKPELKARKRYHAAELSVAVDNITRLIIPIWYAVYLAEMVDQASRYGGSLK